MQNSFMMLKGIEYNSSTKGKYPNGKEIVSIGSTENCESEKKNTEVENDKKVSFDNVTNVG